MNLQALIDLSNIRDLDAGASQRLEAARQRQCEYDQEIEKQVANKRVGPELLRKTCGI